MKQPDESQNYDKNIGLNPQRMMHFLYLGFCDFNTSIFFCLLALHKFSKHLLRKKKLLPTQ